MQAKYYTLRQISERYSIPLSTLRRWASERRFPLYRVSNRILISGDEWNQWIQQHRCRVIDPKSS